MAKTPKSAPSKTPTVVETARTRSVAPGGEVSSAKPMNVAASDSVKAERGQDTAPVLIPDGQVQPTTADLGDTVSTTAPSDVEVDPFRYTANEKPADVLVGGEPPIVPPSADVVNPALVGAVFDPYTAAPVARTAADEEADRRAHDLSRRRGTGRKPRLGEVVLYRMGRAYNGQTELVAIVTQVHGDDTGREAVSLRVWPGAGDPFTVTMRPEADPKHADEVDVWRFRDRD